MQKYKTFLSYPNIFMFINKTNIHHKTIKDVSSLIGNDTSLNKEDNS